MDLKKYSTYVKELIRGTPTYEVFDFVRTLPVGVTRQDFGIMLSGKTVKVKSPFHSLQAVFDIANRIMPQKDYTLSLRVLVDGSTKILSKIAQAQSTIDEVKIQIVEGEQIDRTYYEIINTDDFEITYSEYEGTVLQAKSTDLARQFFQAMVSLFPFADVGKENKQLEVECEFKIDELKSFSREEKRRGDLRCSILLDGKQIGTRGNIFIFPLKPEQN